MAAAVLPGSAPAVSIEAIAVAAMMSIDLVGLRRPAAAVVTERVDLRPVLMGKNFGVCLRV
jgi:hypothetical protein